MTIDEQKEASTGRHGMGKDREEDKQEDSEATLFKRGMMWSSDRKQRAAIRFVNDKVKITKKTKKKKTKKKN